MAALCVEGQHKQLGTTLNSSGTKRKKNPLLRIHVQATSMYYDAISLFVLCCHGYLHICLINAMLPVLWVWGIFIETGLNKSLNGGGASTN